MLGKALLYVTDGLTRVCILDVLEIAVTASIENSLELMPAPRQPVQLLAHLELHEPLAHFRLGLSREHLSKPNRGLQVLPHEATR